MPFDANWIEPAQTPPGTQELYLSDTIAVGRQRNSYSPTAINAAGFLTTLPEEIDTSYPFILRFKFMVTSTGSGGIDITIQWGYNMDIQDDPDSSVSPSFSSVWTGTGSAPTTPPGLLGQINEIISVTANTNNRVLTREYILNVNPLVSQRNTGSNSGDVLWFTFRRNGTAAGDTYGGNAVIIQVTPYYRKWCEGAYIA